MATSKTAKSITDSQDAPHPKSMHTTYYLEDILHVPHYRLPGMFIAPGGVAITEQELKTRGAIAIKQPLYTRDYY